MKRNNLIKQHKYIFIFLLIFVSYIPYLIHFYPGIIISDTYSQMKQAIGLQSLSNHHPVFQTFLWKIFINIGKIFHNDNLAVLLNSFLQMCAIAGVCTYAKYNLDKIKIKNNLLILFYAFYPVFALFAIYTTKDTLFSVSILFYIVELSRLINNPSEYLSKRKNIGLLFISMIFTFLYKNNGIYIITVTQIFLLIFFRKQYLKRLSLIFIAIMVLFIIWNNVILTLLNVKPTEEVERLGIFINQINYIVYNQDVSKTTLQKISNFIDINPLQQKYNKTKIDGIKKYFHEDYFKCHKLEFLKLNVNLFIRYPKESIKAFWNKNKRLIIPNENVLIGNYRKLSNINHKLISKIIKLLIIPIIILFSPAINLYLLIILFLYALLKKRKNIIVLIPIIVVWVAALVAPASLYRYILPSVFCLPYIFYFMNLNRKKCNYE